MDSNPTVPDDAILFNGSADDWVRLFNGQPIAAPGGVLLLFGGERPLDSFVAGLHFVLAFGKTQEGKLLFAGIEHILPKALGTRDVLRGIESGLQWQATDWNWPQQQIEALHNTLRVHQLVTLEGQDVIEALRHAQDGAAVAISCAQTYRFPDIIRVFHKPVIDESGTLTIQHGGS